MEKWSKHATDTLVGQQIETSQIGIDTLAHSGLGWSSYSLTEPGNHPGPEKTTLHPHQQSALADVSAGFEDSSRGKLIMACGKGKTFTVCGSRSRSSGRVARCCIWCPRSR